MKVKDICGNIHPTFMYNLWNFKNHKHTYKLINIIDIDIPKLDSYKGMPKYNTMMFDMKYVGKEVKKQMVDVDADAWVISTMIESKTSEVLHISVDLFKKDTIWNKLIYKIHKSWVKTSKIERFK